MDRSFWSGIVGLELQESAEKSSTAKAKAQNNNNNGGNQAGSNKRKGNSGLWPEWRKFQEG